VKVDKKTIRWALNVLETTADKEVQPDDNYDYCCGYDVAKLEVAIKALQDILEES
jgi:hypothetical protein